MSEPNIICPQCGTTVKLTESLAAPLIESTRREFEQRLATSTAQIAAAESKRARLAVSADLEQKARENAELHDVLRQRETKLAEAQQAQALALRKSRELDDQMRQLDLTVQQRVEASLAALREQTRTAVQDEYRLKLAESQQTIGSMTRQIEDLKRRAEQGSQQLQGEVLELELEAMLRTRFARDLIEPVAKGEHGGDVLQRVQGPSGQICGAILWESKRTRSWNDAWLVKLREDQRTARADVAVIVSQVLPKGVESFDMLEHVWVAHPRVALPLAAVLRQSLLELAAARQAGEGQQTKTEMVYRYLTGPRFRQRVQAIVEGFTGMQEDLDRERKVILKQWAKRQEQIERVMQATVGMYGDLQGIAGKTLQEIEGLELRALEYRDGDVGE